jgi:hypothetical protein
VEGAIRNISTEKVTLHFPSFLFYAQGSAAGLRFVRVTTPDVMAPAWRLRYTDVSCFITRIATTITMLR